MSDDEDFDPLSGPPSLSKAPSSGGGNPTPRSGAPPPPNAFQSTSSSSIGSSPTPRSSPPPPANAFSHQLPARWTQYEDDAAATAATTAAAATTTPSKPGNTNYKLFETPSPSAGLAPPPKSSPPSSSSGYDTAELIRKYGGYRPENQLRQSSTGSAPQVDKPSAVTQRSASYTASGANNKSNEIRSQAMRMLDLVDEQLLSTPSEVRRTQSGGFASAYDMNRTLSTGSASKRVPAALAGLHLTRQDRSFPKPARYSFSDPAFREDEDLDDDEEDDIVLHTRASGRNSDSRGGMDDMEPVDGPLVDVASLEQRGAGSRAAMEYDDANIARTFSGDYDQGRPQSNWSSRYMNNPTVSVDYTKAQQARFLDRMDREHGGKSVTESARELFASTKKSVQSAVQSARSGMSATNEGSQFTFKTSGLFNSQSSKMGRFSGKKSVNLATVWKDPSKNGSDYDDGLDVDHKPPVHKTWQEAMLNKRRRRRTLFALAAVLLVVLIVVPTVLTTNNRQTVSDGLISADDAETQFYVMSSGPYGRAQKEKLTKDLENLPIKADMVFHVGNVQEEANLCPYHTYSGVRSLLQNSPVPVMVVPGDEDWRNCPAPWVSFDRWSDAFGDLEEEFVIKTDVFRLRNRPEVFAMEYEKVMVFGMHLLQGPSDDPDDDAQRTTDMLNFFFGMLKADREDDLRAIVILGSAIPTMPSQADFWKGVKTAVEHYKLPLAYVHGTSEYGDIRLYKPFNDVSYVTAIEAPGAGHPPLRVAIGSGSNPFVIG